jgi:hypothetical protein
MEKAKDDSSWTSLCNQVLEFQRFILNAPRRQLLEIQHQQNSMQQVERIEKFEKEYEKEYRGGKNDFNERTSGIKQAFRAVMSSSSQTVTDYNTNVIPLKAKYEDANKYLTLARSNLAKCKEAFFEKREKWNGGISACYNPLTGNMEWKDSWHHGIDGVFNHATQQIEWREKWNGDVKGVYNPLLKEIEWKDNWHYGIGGCFNPCTGIVEWQEKWNHGVCGVWNPVSQTIEWKTRWNGGVVGYFDHTEKEVKWIESWHHGVALVVYDSYLNDFIVSRGNCWDWSK